MTRWSPGDGDHEVLCFGSDKPRRPGRLLIGVAAASVVVALVVGTPSRMVLVSGLVEGPSAPVAAGVVDIVAGPWDEPVFRLPVFNAGEEEIEATLVGLHGWPSQPRNAATEAIAPGAWEPVRFSVKPDCASSPVEVGAVRLRVATATTRYHRAITLAGRASALVDYHRAVCALRVPMQPRHLLGVWLVEAVYGGRRSPEGRHLIRFEAGGTIVAGPEGQRFPGSRGFRRGYTLDDSVLTTKTEQAYGDACPPGERATWRATSFPDGRLHLAFLDGPGCSGHPGEVWVARRVLTHTP